MVVREQPGQARGLIRSARALVVLVAVLLPISLGTTSQVVGLDPDLTAPTITDLRITNPTLWGNDYNILSEPKHESDISKRPTIGGTVLVGATFSDDQGLVAIGAKVIPGGEFSDNEFTPAIEGNSTLVDAGRYAVSWDTKNGADWRSVVDGEYSFVFTARDGNILNNRSEEIDVTVDNTAPTAEFVGSTPNKDQLVSGNIAVKGKFDDRNGLKNVTIGIKDDGRTGQGVKCSFDWPEKKDETSCDINTLTLPDGIHEVVISAQDKAGNMSGSQFRRIVVNNHVPGVPQLISPVSGSTVNDAGATLDWTSEADGNAPVTYSFRLSQHADMSEFGEQNNLTNSAVTIADVAHGTYFWQVRACDGLGTCSTWSDVWSVTIDKIAPNLTITSVARNTNGTYTVRGTTNGNDPIHLYLDDETSELAALFPTAGAWSYTTTNSLILGEHTFFATSSDGVGNESRISHVFTVSAAPLLPSFGVKPTPLPLITSVARATTGTAIGTGPGSARIDDRASTSQGVLGDSLSNPGEKPAAIEATVAGWQLYGLAWYWWLALLGGVGAGGWALALRLRRPSDLAS